MIRPEKTDGELFEERYDQLISLIKTSSHQCTLYLYSKVAPRGDTDVSLTLIAACLYTYMSFNIYVRL